MNPRNPSGPGSDTDRSRYVFASRWLLHADRDRVWETFDVLLASGDPFVWWPHLGTTSREGGDIHVVASSPIGYRLRFRLHDLQEQPRTRVTLRSDGDLEGSATLTFAPVDTTSSTLDVAWDVQTTPVWMRRAAPLLRPVFVLAHDAVMRGGERALNEWLDDAHEM